MLAAFGLFLATSLFGRLWCGFACPQTVWTDLFMQVERWIEGDRAERMRFDKAPWTPAKWRKRVAKHAAWLLIAFLTGGAWIMYFRDAPTVVGEFFTGQAGLTIYFFVFLFTATTYLLAGMAREQVCTYMCPWPRIQGALVDQDTMAVTYESWRGEPRGKYRKGESFDGRGDCIDCKQCVAVCPMGIDIRDGFQLECIGCGLCIDACDEVMDEDRPAAEADRLRQRAQPGAACGGPARRCTGWCGRARSSIWSWWRASGSPCWRSWPCAPRSTSTSCPTATRCSSPCPTAASATATRSGS